MSPSVERLAVAPTAVSGPPAAARTSAIADTLLGEVKPSTQALTASLRRTGLEPAVTPDAAALQTRLDRLAPAAACVPVVLAPAAGRPGTTWVDLSGDGLIVSAVASAHVAAVFARAGAAAEAGSHCLAPASVKELLGSVQRTAGASRSMKLVKVAQGWQLVAPPARAAAVRPPAVPKKQARSGGRPTAKV